MRIKGSRHSELSSAILRIVSALRTQQLLRHPRVLCPMPHILYASVKVTDSNSPALNICLHHRIILSVLNCTTSIYIHGPDAYNTERQLLVNITHRQCSLSDNNHYFYPQQTATNYYILEPQCCSLLLDIPNVS